MPLHFAPAVASRYSNNYWLPADSSLVQESRVNPWPPPNEKNPAPSSSPAAAPVPEDVQVCLYGPGQLDPGCNSSRATICLSVCLSLSVSNMSGAYIQHWIRGQNMNRDSIWFMDLWTGAMFTYTNSSVQMKSSEQLWFLCQKRKLIWANFNGFDVITRNSF